MAKKFMRMILTAMMGVSAFTAEAQTGKFYSSFLPDTVRPYDNYPSITVAGPFTGIRRWPNEVALKHGATTLPLTGDLVGDGTAQFALGSIPSDADPGSYDAYSPSGTLLERNVTFVLDVGKIVPRLNVARGRGMRGNKFIALTGNGTGLPFGPLPTTASAPYLPAVSRFALEHGKDTIPILSPKYPYTGQNINDIVQGPYHFYGMVEIPLTASFGSYRLVVERNDGIRTIVDSVFEVIQPPAPANVTVTPDSLRAGDGVTMELTGLNLEYGTLSGSFVNLDRTQFRGAYLRHGTSIVSANDLELGVRKSTSLGWVTPILAKFAVPASFPVGPCDLGIEIAARGDTTYFPGIVYVRDPAGIVPPWSGEAAASVARRHGNHLSLSLREPAVVELRTVSGRLLLSLGRLTAGEHEFFAPPSAQGESLLLCRLRAVSGEFWLRVPGMR
jgi:hypothetical protein